MAQWISIEEATAKYGFETEYIWVLIEMREITVNYERPGIDIVSDDSVQEFMSRNEKGATLMYLSLLGKQDKEITRYKAAGILYDTLQIKWLKQCDRVQKLEKELVLGQTTCCTCWLKRICMKIRK